jgi:hypothetical protein
MATALTVLILGAGAYFVGLLLYKTVGVARAVSGARASAQADLAQSLAGLSTDDLRQRLLRDPYLLGLRSDAAVQAFLTRVEQGDEVALAQKYPRARLSRVLATAERTGGQTGRPEALDAISEVSGILQELARRRSQARG